MPCLLHSVPFILISENPQKLLLLMPCLLHSVSFFLHFGEPTEASSAYALSATLCLILSSFRRTHRSFICLCHVCYRRCLIFVPFREPTKDSSALALSATIAHVRSSLQRASGSVHLLWAHLLPEAEAHGGGQDARPGQRASRGPHAPAHRGASQGRWAAAGRDGERLPHWIWSQVCALLCALCVGVADKVWVGG